MRCLEEVRKDMKEERENFLQRVCFRKILLDSVVYTNCYIYMFVVSYLYLIIFGKRNIEKEEFTIFFKTFELDCIYCVRSCRNSLDDERRIINVIYKND